MRSAVLALAAAALTACGGSPAPAAPAPTPPPAPAPGGPTTITYTAPVPMSPEPAPTAPPASWTMPDLVGSGLQEAQDAIQRLTNYGIVITTSHDATGAGRVQVADRNWKVCSQNVPPGETITSSSRIDFGVVRLDESC